MPHIRTAGDCLIAIIQASTERLKAMPIEQTAKFYGQSESWVRMSRDHELGRRDHPTTQGA